MFLLVYFRKEREKDVKRKTGKRRKEERKGNEGFLDWFPGSF
jgi:hypothetical protein